MKQTLIGCLLLMAIFAFSCVPARERRIETSLKVAKLLNEDKAAELHRMIELEADNIGKTIEKIEHDCRSFQRITRKYGMPIEKNAIYLEDVNDATFPYKVTLPLFSGDDTLRNWRVRKIDLLVLFGPTEFNRPTRIASYEIVYDRDVLPLKQ